MSAEGLARCLDHNRGCLLAILRHRAGLCPEPSNADSLLPPEQGAVAHSTGASTGDPRQALGQTEGEGEHRAAAPIFEVGREE